jgi:uncharacterized protein (DUF2141 family)
MQNRSFLLGRLRMRGCVFPCLISALTLLIVTAMAAPSTGPSQVVISGQIAGTSGRHSVYVALWDEQGFLVRPVQQLRIAPGAVAVFRFQAPPGRWAISAYEDENENGILDMGAFGPREPSGFWRPFHGWRKPRFADVAVAVGRDTLDADIRLGK